MTIAKLLWKEVSVDKKDMCVYGGDRYVVYSIKYIKRK